MLHTVYISISNISIYDGSKIVVVLLLVFHECINIGYVCSVWQDRVREEAQTKGRSLSESLLKVVAVFASPFLPWALWFAQLVAFWLDLAWLGLIS